MRLRSLDTLDGMHRVTGKPCAAPIMAYAMPVFPLVESSRILPGPNFPLARASATMFDAARSFTDPPGLSHSALPRSWILGRSRAMRSSRNSGVLPMRSRLRWPKPTGVLAGAAETVLFTAKSRALVNLREVCCIWIHDHGDHRNV